jgi:anti-anti-sigma regulatory factor
VTGAPRALAIDLRDCGFIDSTAISVLLRSQGAADEKDVDFALIASTESQPYRVLRLTRCLPDRIRAFASREEAAGALSPPA